MNKNVTTILGTRIDAISWAKAIENITTWADKRESRIVSLCNVHVAVSARSDAGLRHALDSSDMILPDGAPLVWLMHKRSWPEQQRISGPDLMWCALAQSEQLGLSVFFYGGTEHALQKLISIVRASFPSLQIAGHISPPFRAISDDEESSICNHIKQSGAKIIMVGLGCPKQEKWMARHKGQLHAVMLGVGAAFDYHAGTLQRAPLAWQHAGFEWLYRLMKEPTRLMKRYLLTNTLFLIALPWELWNSRRN
jgi:N-acetylglucosaminyldiphosphoundecaprenol N-acetyl-beta-D-mannosaminyltransferase